MTNNITITKIDIKVYTRKELLNTMGDNFKKRVKIGGVNGIIHIIISFVVVFIIFCDSSLQGDIMLWNAFILNAPVTCDFLHNYYCVPKEKIGKVFKVFSIGILIILILSFILSMLYIGIDYAVKTKQDFAKFFMALILICEKFSIIFNPFGVFCGYVCNILKEEYRIELIEAEENENKTGGELG